MVTGRREFTVGRHLVEGDIADGDAVDQVFAEHPDIAAVVHCAALIVVPNSVADPVGYYRANVTASLEFVGHLLRHGCTRMLFSSSASIYRPNDDFSVDEDSAIGPQSPYAATKAVCEQMFADVAAGTRLRVLRSLAINLGTGTGTTVTELVAAFNTVVDEPVAAQAAGPRPGDVAGAYSRGDRAGRLLGWRPMHTVAEGITDSLRWAAVRDQRLS